MVGKAVGLCSARIRWTTSTSIGNGSLLAENLEVVQQAPILALSALEPSAKGSEPVDDAEPALSEVT